MPVRDTNLLPCGVLVLDAENHIVSLNPYVCSLLDYEPNDLIGQRIDRLLTMASRIYFQTHIYPLIKLRKAASELYVNLQTRQRERVPVLLNAVWYEHTDEPQIYFSFIPVRQRRQFEQELINAKKAAEDALLRNDELTRLQTELEQHQTDLDQQLSQLRQRNDDLEQLSKILSHDLKEPIRKITLFADLLTSETPDAPDELTTRALTGVAKAAARLRQLVGDLQFYFALTNEPPDNAIPVDLTALVAQTAQEFDATLLTCETNALPAVPGNQSELTNLFRQLLDNAVKFRQPGQTATVRVAGDMMRLNSFRNLPHKYRYTNFARIVVADNGIGFNNRQRDDIFRILRKLDPHTPGIGLGLAIAKKIVERHNGQISAESVEDGGTRITILLPVA